MTGDLLRTRRSFLRSTGVSLATATSLATVDVVSAAGGRELWARNFGYSAGVSAQPTVVDGTVYAGSNYRGNVYALDAASGKTEWEYTQTSGGGGGVIGTAPHVVDGTVYAMDGFINLHAIDAADGTREWEQFVTYGIQGTSPTVADGTVYAFRNGLEAYAADDGSLIRRYGSPPPVPVGLGNSAPVVAGDRLLVCSPAHTYTFPLTEPERDWRFPFPGYGLRSEESSPTFADGTVYTVASGGGSAILYALPLATGESAWQYDIDANVTATPTVADGTVYLGDDAGRVHAIGTDGEGDWVMDLPNQSRASAPTVAGDLLFVGTQPGVDNDAKLTALRVDDGSVAWEGPPGWATAPVVVDGIAFVGSAQGVQAFTAGVEGRSEDTRVALGTEGHHNAWAGRPPQTDLLTAVSGTVTDPEGDPVQGVDCYLASSGEGYRGLRLIENYPDNDPPSDVLSVPASSTTGEDGGYTLPQVDPGQKFVLVLPPSDSDYAPTLVSDVVVATGEQTTVDVQLSEHPLACLDPAVDQLGTQSQGHVDLTTRTAAGTVVNLSDDLVTKGVGNLVGDLLPAPVEADDVDSVVEDTSAALVEAGIEFTQTMLSRLLNLLRDEVPNGLPEATDTLGRSPLFDESVTGYDTVDDLTTGVYTALPPYTGANQRITAATDQRYEDIVSQYGPEDPALQEFSVPAAKSAVRQTVRQIQYPDYGLPGFVITPTGDLYQIGQADRYQDDVMQSRELRSTTADGQAIAQAGQVVGGVLVLTGVGGAAGGTVYTASRALERGLEAANFALLLVVAIQTGLTQIGWYNDLRRTAAVDETVVDWLDSALSDGLSAGDMTLSNVDMNLERPAGDIREIDGPNFVVANRPSDPQSNDVVDINWAAVEDLTVEIENTGETTAQFRVTFFDVFGSGSVSNRATVDDADAATRTLDPGETVTVEAEYAATFGGLGGILQDHTATVLCWSDGVIVDSHTVHYQVRPSPDLDLPQFDRGTPSGRLFAAETEPRRTLFDGISATRAAVEAARSTTTTLLEAPVSPESPVAETTHTVPEGITAVEYTLSAPGDVALQVRDGSGNVVGYVPGDDAVRTDLPDATYRGPAATPQTASFTAEPGATYTVRAVGYRFLDPASVPVTVRAWETPDRDAIVTVGPPDPQAFVTPGRTTDVDVRVAEAGGQVDAAELSVSASSFPDGISVSGPDSLTVPAGGRKRVTLSFEAADDFDPEGAPADTRFEGALAVASADTGSVILAVDGLALATDTTATLRAADRSVEGVALSAVDVSGVSVPSDVDLDPDAAYELTVYGSGSVEVALPSQRETVVPAVYAAGSSWRDLPTGRIGGRTTATVDTDALSGGAGDAWTRTLVVEERPLPRSTGSGESGDTDGDGRADTGGDATGDDSGSGDGGLLFPAAGVAAAVTAAAATGYVLRRRLGSE